MSKLAIAAAGALTVTSIGLLALSQFESGKFPVNETPEAQKARLQKEALQAWCVFGGIAVTGTVIALKTSHSDLGKGMVLGSAGLVVLGLLSTVTEKA